MRPWVKIGIGLLTVLWLVPVAALVASGGTGPWGPLWVAVAWYLFLSGLVQGALIASPFAARRGGLDRLVVLVWMVPGLLLASLAGGGALFGSMQRVILGRRMALLELGIAGILLCMAIVWIAAYVAVWRAGPEGTGGAISREGGPEPSGRSRASDEDPYGYGLGTVDRG